MATKNFNVSELDFFTIKELLKTHFENQSEFSDHDFEGAGLSVLLDLLAYSTHYTGVQTNLAFAETFLDSAVRRGAVTSRAKELGYTPRSKTASTAKIRISFSVSGNPAQYVLPKGTRFSASANGTTFTFVTTQDQIIENDGNDVFTDEITIAQGKFSTISYTVDLNDARQRFVLGSKNADTKYLTVLHKDTAQSSTFNQYSFIDDIDIGTLVANSQVYFLRETYDEFYEVYFGDGTIGKAVENGNVVELTYLITDGADANGANTFTLASSLSTVSGMSITTIDSASAGGDRESIESIKYLAPFYYQSQGRAVTKDDYKAILKSNYSNVDDVTVWGGEDNDPPFYGKVFIAVKPKSSSMFSNSVKQSIQNDVISRFNVMSIRPEIVDPDYIDVAVESTVTYNARLFDGTTNSGLEDDIRTSITDFFSEEANKFGQPLYFSKLVTAIDETSDLILNSVNNLTLSKSKEIFSGVSADYKYSFNNSIKPGAVSSNEFTIDGVNYFIRDIPQGSNPYLTGKVAIYRVTNEGATVYLSQDAGDIDYNKGTVNLENVTIDSIVNDSINKLLTVSVVPGAFADQNNLTLSFIDSNVYTNDRDEIVRLKDGGISLTLLPDETV